MPVLKEWRCVAHDLAFESFDEKPRCPSGCSNKFVRQEFRTPVGIRSGGTRIQDQMVKQLADDYRMTDMRNGDDGESVKASTRTESGGTKVVGQPKSKAYWNPGLFQPKPGWAQRGEPEPTFNARAAGIKDGGVPIKAIQQGAREHLRKATVFANPEKQRK
jgi:hypothetical protein